MHIGEFIASRHACSTRSFAKAGAFRNIPGPMSPDDALLVTGGLDSTIKVWDMP